MENHLLFTLISFVFFTALVGVIAAKMVTSDDQTTSKGYFLAGQGLTGIFIAGSMLLTNISAEGLVGLNGQSYGKNLSGMAWESTAVIATVVMALVFLPIYLRKGYTTLPEFLEDRYDKGVRRLVSLLFLAGYTLFGIPVCLYAGAIGFNQIFDLSKIFGISPSLSMTIMIILLGIIGALYAVFGGLKAVAVSDTINGVLLIIGGLLVPILGLWVLGKTQGGGIITGLSNVVNTNPEKLSAIGGPKDPVPFPTIFTGMLLANLFYWGTNQVLIQRVLGAKNLKEGQKGVLLSGFFKILVPIILLFPGIIAFHLIPGLPKADFAYPQLVARVLPWPLVGLFCAALFGAIISTYNSLLNSASTIFMLDVYKPAINPNIKDHDLVKKAKIVGIIMAIFAMVVAPSLQSVDGIYNFGRAVTGFYNMPIIAAVLAGMFTKRATALGIKIAVGFHIVFYTLMKYVIKIDTPDSLLGFSVHFLHVFAFSVICMFVIMFVVSLIKPDVKEFNRNSVVNKGYDMTPWEHAAPISFLLIAFLVYIYVILSPLGIATENKNYGFIITVTLVMAALALIVFGKIAVKKYAGRSVVEEAVE